MDCTDPTRGRDETDSIGTADLTYDAEPGGRVAASRPRLLTPEARAVTGAFLVLTGLLATTLPQYLTYVLLNGNGNGVNPSPVKQYLALAGATGLFALAGAAVAWPATRTGPTAMIRALALAAVVVGTIVVLLVLGGLVPASQVAVTSTG